MGFLGQQAPQNFGDATLYTYKSLSPISENPHGLFLRVRVVKGHQLPPEWLQRYFHGANVDADADPDGDSVSNWEEFLHGTDPTDYYNAQAPQLFVAGGGNQRGNAGTLLPLPVSIKVNYWGDQNAPLAFTATGGALLAPDANGTFQPSATISVRSTGQINVDGSQTYVAQAYVYLPATVSAVSTLTASAATAGQTATVSTVAIASDPNLSPPGGVEVGYNTDSYVHLLFNPADGTRPVSIEVSQDLGASWSTWAVAAPGATAYDVEGLPHDVRLLLRAFTGADGGAAASTKACLPTEAPRRRPPRRLRRRWTPWCSCNRSWRPPATWTITPTGAFRASSTPASGTGKGTRPSTPDETSTLSLAPSTKSSLRSTCSSQARSTC